VRPRLTVIELFDRGLRRSRQAPLEIVGETCTGAEDNCASFSLDETGGKIHAVSFRASCCATLIAYCECIAAMTPGVLIEMARELTAANLVASVPGVPALKRDRAVLAIAAFRAALLAAHELQAHESNNGAVSDEGRLHRRHPAP
jgi:NifU-like protein involved in Fe-S cluster formation